MIVTRFAPSPTGYLHIGGARTALFSWLLARQQGGRFVLRIEDTDLQRSTQESVDAILQGMQWLGLDWDEGPFFQTQRLPQYKAVIQQLLDEGKAYHCYCSKETLEQMRNEAMQRGAKPRYNGKCRNYTGKPPAGVAPVVRFKNPLEGVVTFNDEIRGAISVSNAELDDLIIARADGSPTYNFTVVVDDRDMGITHVVRGDDHVNNTPRQINILKALESPLPVYAHVPMILGADGGRLSKRHGAMSVMQYAEDGYLPSAVLNYLVRLGWAHGDEEIFSLHEMIDKFSLQSVNKSAAAFNIEKLQWFNRHYIKNTDATELAAQLEQRLTSQGISIAAGPALEDVVEVLRERVKTLAEMAEQSVMFYQDYASFDEKAAKKQLRPVIAEPLRAFRQRLAGLDDWNADAIQSLVEKTAEDFTLNMGKIGQPIRVAVTGGGVSPPINRTIYLIGKSRALRGLDKALSYIEKRAIS